MDLDKNVSGSIYVIRVRPKDAFRIISPIGLKEFYGTEEDHDEDEYLIPDFVDPEEIIKEFRYNDYIGVYKFLRNEIGLNIERSDIGLKANINEQPELSDKFLNYIRKRNQLSNKYWEDTYGGNSSNFQEITKIINSGKGNTNLEKMINALFDPHDDDPR